MSIKPLLSICIPTYNRAGYLEKSLDSLVCLPEFNSSEVEVVICDNASTDATKETVIKYLEKYKNVYYYKNDVNIKDKNFPTVIKLANGCFRKLCNDTLIYEKGYLSCLLYNVKLYQRDKPFIFLPNHNLGRGQRDEYVCSNIDEFLRLTSFYVTWIGAFGLWEDDIPLIEDWFCGWETSLWQTKTLLEILSKKNKMIILNKKIVSIQEVENKNLSYGLYNVFYKNYLHLLKIKLDEGAINELCYNFLRKDLLLNFFSLWCVNYKIGKQSYLISENDNLEDLIKLEYRNESYFVFYLCKVRFYLFKNKLKTFLSARQKTI